MGTRCLLALLSILFMLLGPVTSFPTRSNEQSHKSHAGVTSFLRMLKDQILSRSRGTSLSGTSRGAQGHQQITPNVNSLNIDLMPVWPPRPKVNLTPKADVAILANDSDRDFSADVEAGVSGLEDNKRGSDYGHGFFFGKRAPSDTVANRHQDESTNQRDRKASDYHWGMYFGKRGKASTYGWGGFFGKRNGDVIEYEDFVA